MRSVTVAQRRAALVARHRLDGRAENAQAVVAALLAVHATDPATVYLSVLARSHDTSIPEVAAALYDERDVVRWMAMRRTLFVFAKDDIPMVQAGVSDSLAAALHRRLVGLIERNGLDPAPDGAPASWLDACAEQVESVVARRGAMTGVEIRGAVPALRASIPPRTRSETRQSLTSPLLTIMSTEGRLVRGAPTGAWTTRNHRWEPSSTWWPEGLPRLEAADAQAMLASRWLARFGPATAEDLQWWTGWNRTTTTRALGALQLEDIDLHGRPGIDLAGLEPEHGIEPSACLLPALDSTPMGWKHRDWFTPDTVAPLYDTAGNIGPTIWWDGEVVGGWASTPSGIRTRLLADRGSEAAAAISAAAEHLERRLDGVAITPAARTPLERELST